MVEEDISLTGFRSRAKISVLPPPGAGHKNQVERRSSFPLPLRSRPLPRPSHTVKPAVPC